MTEVHDIEQLAVDLAAAMPKLGRTEQRLALTLLRELAYGAPVGIDRLTVATDLPSEQIAATLERLPGAFRDEQRRVIGFMGLTVLEMGEHRIHLHRRTFSAWCAWDTLFLPELLGETAAVTSRCPITGEQISLTVSPTGPADLQPRDAVISFLLPKVEFDASVIRRFCHIVHFFASPEAAAEWTAEHPGTFVLSVKDAYQLGRLTNRAVWNSATAASFEESAGTSLVGVRRYSRRMSRTLQQRIHNPRNRECWCDPDCWCRRTALGRAVKWWFPGRYFGLHHKRRAIEEWRQSRQETL